jgi:DNA mismatch endonuclease (patch repair protein)
MAVFIDGCFWHACPLHFVAPKTNVDYWEAKIERNRLRDRATTEALLAEGWTVLRFWAHEQPADVANQIVSAFRQATDF